MYLIPCNLFPGVCLIFVEIFYSCFILVLQFSKGGEQPLIYPSEETEGLF